jgi:hypothetical protein
VIFEVKKRNVDKAYDVNCSITSSDFAKFLDMAASKDRFTSCPRIRRVANSGDASLGACWLSVLKPNEFIAAEDSYRKVDSGGYVSGERMPRLGYNIIPESSFAQFIIDCLTTLTFEDGLLRAHMQNGFISANMGGVDFFYGFVFACYRARLSEKECLSLLPSSGVRGQYPETFNANMTTLSDIQALYKILTSTNKV